MSSSIENIPNGYVIYPHQVAGHRFEEGRQGMLIDNDGKLLKPIQEPPRGERELSFYQTVFDKDVSDPTTIKLRSFLPAFYGTKVVPCQDSAFKDKYIRLEDLTRCFSKPCILDIKIGQFITDHLATEVKTERAKSKYPEQEIFGFRILGMKVYRADLRLFKFYDKSFGKNLKTHQDVMEGLQEFFRPNDHGKQHILKVLEQCWKIKTWILEQRKFKLFSSSILIVYEGDSAVVGGKSFMDYNESLKKQKHSNCHVEPSNGTRDGLNQICEHKIDKDRHHYDCCTVKDEKIMSTLPVSVHLVDFAHTYLGNFTEPDRNYLFGLQNLICCFEELVTEF